jgi:flagellar biosynthetic protein FliQ
MHAKERVKALEQFLLDIARDAMMTTLKVGAPVMIIGLVVGLIVSIFQATTQIQEQSLHFVPKIVAMLIALLLLGSWMLTVMKEFTLRMFNDMLKFIGM